MISSLLRKFGQLVEDAALRRWLIERSLGRTPAPPAYTAHHPPYLDSLDLGQAPYPDDRFGTLDAKVPDDAITLDLAGLDVTLMPASAGGIYERSFDDIEQWLALHRFAWIEETTDPAWVVLLWREWLQRYSKPDSTWPWHPYTAAERLINLLGVFERHGLPAPYEISWNALAAHGRAIASNLEYFGPHYTGNHLANNGRGLFRLGTAFGWTAAADLGGKILLTEAKRIFGASGMLIEGSTHYHLLLAKNYAEAARWAAEANRPEADELSTIASKTGQAAGGLILSGGLPLIGDISPDLPPGRLVGAFERTDADLSADGWHRFEFADWSMLLYAAPDGWPPMPGHGHQDLGSFELHWRGLPLFVDAGRGQYGESGEAALYRSAKTHNGISLDGGDPRPANRPYYAPSFRRSYVGPEPAIKTTAHMLSLAFPMKKTMVERRFVAGEKSLEIDDRVSGKGTGRIERGLVTDQPVTLTGKSARIHTPKGDVELQADVLLQAHQVRRWNAYGNGAIATRLSAVKTAQLPWQSRLTLRTL